MAKVLISEFGADVNAKGEDDNTPLHFAAKEGHIAIAKLLTSEFGANANLKDKNGCKPLYFAEKQENVEMVKILAEALGADDMTNEVPKLGTAPNVIPQHEHQDKAIFANNLASSKQRDTAHGLSKRISTDEDTKGITSPERTVVARKATAASKITTGKTATAKTTASSLTATSAKSRSAPKVALANTTPAATPRKTRTSTLTESKKTSPARSVAYPKAPRDANPVVAEKQTPARSVAYPRPPATRDAKPAKAAPTSKTPTSTIVDKIKPESIAIIVQEPEPSTFNPPSHSKSTDSSTPSDKQLRPSSLEPSKGLRSKSPSRIPIKAPTSMNRNKRISPPESRC
ncbi:hypothetical protein BC936DRAFT_143845 [Jimgerdemannia flammicorona]|uniref:Uncharacterized protein n=1 Tax=Jimgerdemannia flammicorona TaxID=994334 RepID=A0A432ZYG8_9FUNG|nr:hypothetical protein BC936DRAFT_143845 [Jimgerdemannia flammicorona]